MFLFTAYINLRYRDCIRAEEKQMPEIVENAPFVPNTGSWGKKLRTDGHRSESSRIVAKLKALSSGQCVTLLPETGLPNELERKRVHWHNAATRAGLRVTSRVVTTEAGDRAIRIWRLET